MEAGACIQQKTIYDETARECASRYNKMDCVDYLDRSGKATAYI